MLSHLLWQTVLHLDSACHLKKYLYTHYLIEFLKFPCKGGRGRIICLIFEMRKLDPTRDIYLPQNTHQVNGNTRVQGQAFYYTLSEQKFLEGGSSSPHSSVPCLLLGKTEQECFLGDLGEQEPSPHSLSICVGQGGTKLS